MFRLLCTFIILVFASACSSVNYRDLEELARDSGESVYRISGGDTINVDVWGEPRLSGQIFVRDDGSFTLPLINDVQAKGKTLKETGDIIAKKLTDFVPGASVSVSVAHAAPIKYYLSGTFTTPGEYKSDGAITLLQAIATGGGFGPFADETSIILIRKSAGGDIRYRLDYNQVVDGSQPNPDLRNGDIIAVK